MLVVNGCLLAVVAAAAVVDLLTGKVPNWLTYPAAALGLGAWAFMRGWPGVGSSAAGLAVGFVPLFILYRTGAGLGGGDVKLMGAVGALRGWLADLVEMAYQGTGYRRVKNPRIWSMHDLAELARASGARR